MTIDPALADTVLKSSAFLVVYAIAIGLDYRFVRHGSRRRAYMVLALEAAILLPLPLIFGREDIVVRFLFSVLAALKIARCVELATDRVKDTAMVVDWRRFIIWQMTGSDTVWPRSDAERRANRMQGLRLLVEGGLYAAAVGALVWVLSLVPSWPDAVWSRSLAMLLIMGLTLPALTAFTSIGPLLMGIKVERVMRHPLLARSLHEFWGRRWNIAFRDIAHRGVYRPLRDRGLPVWLAVIGVFAVSGIAHEYLVLTSVGSHAGEMSAFFLSQALLVLIERPLLQRMPARIQVPLGYLWMWGALLVTAPLFFDPFTRIIDIVGISRWIF